MEMETPAHDGTTVVVAGARTSKKRSLDEVVPPAFVAEDDDGAYGVAEMPKRFVVNNHHKLLLLHDNDKYSSKYSSIMAAFHALDVRITALNESDRRETAALLQKLRAKDAARAAAAKAAGES